ncbi:acyl transferase/acyl hydrolase/lysophospholipase [Phakopsora pachyrhizi]|uniref:Lysophospholipase n=1 Tax=Phakopsora pachyrhizi TaxID=170000 RepID=A0AAV0ANM8_PHAPC|nr:acyl transferase/acyl hydrolase/lysophospholipase [Phakopsora pachyrhizi]
MQLFGKLAHQFSNSFGSFRRLPRLRSDVLLRITSGSLALASGAAFLKSRLVSRCDQADPGNGDGTQTSWIPFKGIKSQLETISERYSQILAELSGESGSLYHTVLRESSTDLELHPELEWSASVRLGTEIGLCERAFNRRRKRKIKRAFSNLIGVDESIIDERDLPIVGIAASGGGYRAMTFTTGCLLGARNSGILDVTSYVAGISGSCWALAVWYSLADGNLDKLRSHLMSRITTPFLDLSNLGLLVEKPTDKYLLSGLIAKASTNTDSLSLVDIYGTLVSSRLLVPDDISKLDFRHLKISNQRRLLDGSLPLPIYCTINHLLAHERTESLLEKKSRDSVQDFAQNQSFTSSSYHWYELTPYEVGSEDVGAFIPTWALGRVFEDGKDIKRSPELSLSILNGIFASAFTATLAHYYNEVKNGLGGLPFFSVVENYVSRFETDLAALHPFPPAELPNFLYGLRGSLKPALPASIVEGKTLGLLDAGAELNIPYVPLYRRECDVIISLDASADSQDVWFTKAEEYAKKFGMKTWPSVKYPESEDKKNPQDTMTSKSNKRSGIAVEKSKQQALSESQKNDETTKDSTPSDDGNPFPAKKEAAPSRSEVEEPLGVCNIWVGDSKDPNNCRMDRVDEDLVMKRNGPVLIYIPLTPGEGLEDPSELWSTWNFAYTPDQTNQLMSLSEKNFRTGEKEMVKVLRSIWKRKRDQRLKVENSRK